MPPGPFTPSVDADTRLARLGDSAREARAEGLLISTSGNFSVRLDERTMAISAARTRLGQLTRDQILTVPLDAAGAHAARVDATGAASAGSLRPSRETPMHRAVYNSRSEAASVLHFQSPYATLLACHDGPLPALDFIPEFPVYVRRTARVAYLPPGSEELGAAVATAFADPEVRVVLLGNHGQIAWGDCPEQAVERATFFEFACRLFALSESSAPLRLYSPEELDLLRSF